MSLLSVPAVQYSGATGAQPYFQRLSRGRMARRRRDGAREHRTARNGAMHRFVRENGLTLVMTLLFLFALVGQTLTGWSVFNDDQQEHGSRPCRCRRT